MRTLILTTAYKPLVGGSELAIENITSRLPEEEFDLVTYRFSSQWPAYEKIGPVNVFRVDGSFKFFNGVAPKSFLPLAIFWKARQLLKKRKYDLVHVFQASQAGGAGWLLKWFYPKLPLILTLQEGQDLKKQKFILKFFRSLIFKKADRATAISSYLKDYFLEYRPTIPVALIPNGVDFQKFSREFSYGDIAQLAERLGIKPGEKVIVSASRFTFKNGLDQLIRAAAYLEEKKTIGGFRLLLLGEGEFPADKAHLESLAREGKISHRVTFAGTISHEQLPLYLKLSHVFVRPSRSEGLGTAFLEAMAAGLPVIGSARGGMTDFLTDLETGLVCDPESPEDIAQKIVLILADEKLRQKIIKNARELVEQKYNWDKIAPEYKKIYSIYAS